MKRFLRISALLSLCVFFIGCYNDEESGLVDANYQGEPLTTIKGTVSFSDSNDLPESISLGIFWYGLFAPSGGNYFPDFDGEEGEVSCDGTIAPYQSETYIYQHYLYSSVQSVQYETQNLFEFSIPIYDPPPEEARIDLSFYSGEGWIAHGVVVAFADNNDNGVLDRGTPDSAGDQIFAVSRDMGEYNSLFGSRRTEVVFLNGEIGSDFNINSCFDPDQPLNFCDIWTPFSNAEFEQGFNIMVAANEAMTTTTVTVEETDFLIEVIPIGSESNPWLRQEMECQSTEIRHDFNGPIPNLSEVEYFMVHQCYIPNSEDEEHTKSIEWFVGETVANEPCTYHRMDGFACFDPGIEVPEVWEEICEYYEI